MSNTIKKAAIIWIIGGPGSGKGTLCSSAKTKYGFIHISTGDLLRKEVSTGSQKGKDIQKIMLEGKLVSDNIIVDLLKNEIKLNQTNTKGFLIDGFPRQKLQGILFEKEIAPADLIIFLDAPEEVLIKRIVDRGAAGSGRVDDNDKTAKLRIQTFKDTNQEILDQFGDRIKVINSDRVIEEVFKDAEKLIDPLLA